MSLAKQMIGEPIKVIPSTEQQQESEPIHAMDLIDTLAEQEFASAMEAETAGKRAGVGTPTTGGTPACAGKKGKSQKGKLATGKTTKGQVASTPTASDPVKYGKR